MPVLTQKWYLLSQEMLEEGEVGEAPKAQDGAAQE